MVNNLARSVTKWTQVCDRRLARLISCHVENTGQHCRLDLFQDSDLLVILRTQNQLQEVSCVFLEVEHLLQSVGCARNRLLFGKDQKNLKSFLWMLDCVWMGWLALDFWDVVVEVLRSTNSDVQPKHASHQETGTVLDPQTKTQNVKRRQKVERF